MLFPGVKSISLDVLEENAGEQILIIKYDWPQLMYTVEDLYLDDNNKMKIPKYHPEVMAVEKALQNVRNTIEDIPTGHIKINLPCKVNLEASTWQKSFIKKSNGSIVAFLKFECLKDNYYSRKTERVLIIE